VVLYELLCGRRPFEAKTTDELEDQILHREARPPRQVKDSIPQALERACLKALSKRVQDRYTTAKDMATEVSAAIGSKNRKRDQDTPMSLQEVERRMASADADEVRRLLRYLQKSGDPACVRLVFSHLSHSSEMVRQQARKVVHSLGWDKVSATAEAMARQDDVPGIASVLNGLAAFEAHPQIVALLDKLVVLLKGDLRNRTILLLERKRLGLELDAVVCLFADIHSPYRIDKALGQGLFAAAYLAHAEGTDLAVVVRVLRPEFVGQPHLRARFLDLGKQALKLVHENLVLTREARAFPERNMYFTVRDYVNGVTLQKVLEGGKRFEPAQIVRILRQLLAALGAVHRQGMCHGGVKPSNVFVCGEDQVVLGDLALPVHGIGVALDRLSYDYRYAAPETFRGDQIVATSDFYSLGCLAYELACAEPPFVSDNYLELAARHMHEQVVPPSRRSSKLGPAWDEVLLKLLASSHADRYARTEDILAALDRLEGPWGIPHTEDRPLAAPLLRDASLAGLQGAESVLGFDASSASLTPLPSNTLDSMPDAAPQALQMPAKVGDYDILESLGSGGMGIVYKARDRRLDRVVALKTLRSIVLTEAERLFGAASSDRLKRFLTEARAVARLQHPYIVQIHAIGEQDGQPYIALEYVGGGNLSDKLGTQTLAPSAAAEMVAKLARAVHHAHEHGVLHRDLKPSNVLLTLDGEPKIGDFGLAKIQELSKEDAVLTHSGMIIGTPSYMAPEQAAGEINLIGPATDIYSLGAILYASLTGRPPFQGESIMRMLSQLATAPVIPPNALNPAVNVDLSAICLKCLEKDPAKRYSSAQALAEDLERWCTGQPIQAQPASSINRFLRWCRRSLAHLFLFRKHS
jgi:serine/threonine protein kinase